HITYGEVAKWMSTAPATTFGFGDRKGRLAPGLDADIVLVDAGRKWQHDPTKQFSLAKMSPFRGHEFVGRVEIVLARGCKRYEAGRVLSEPGDGQFIRPSSAGL